MAVYARIRCSICGGYFTQDTEGQPTPADSFPCPACSRKEGMMTEHIEQFFAYEHLPAALAQVSRPFCELAHTIIETIPRNAERTVALRKLLEAKDAAVRAYIAKEP